MANPYRKSWTARPTDEIRNDPAYIRSRAAQGALLDTVGGPSDLANYLSDYFYSGLNSLLDVGGLSPYNVPQSLGTTNRRPIPGGAPQLEQAMVQSGAMGPSTGTTQETAMRMGLGLLDPTPVGAGSLTGPRGKNVFYSGLLDTAQNAPMQKGSADQWMGYLQNQPGVKQAELEWTGVEDWLKNKDRSVTRQELEDYLQETEIQVQEIVKGGLDPESTAYSDMVVEAIDKYVDQNKRRFDIVYDDDENGFVLIDENGEFLRDYGGSVRSYGDRDGAIDELDYILEEEARQMPEGDLLASVGFKEEGLLPGGGTKYPEYTYETYEAGEAGGENYRELLLTVPSDNSKKVVRRKELAAIDRERPLSIEEQREYDTLQKEVKGTAGTFKSSHWNEPNVVAHVRFNDRTTPEGERVLFLEEIQSDWAQEGRKKGFIPTEEEKIKASNKIKELRKQQQELLLKYDETKDPVYNEQWQKIEDQIPALGRLAVVSDTGLTSRVPRAPFVQNTEQWTSLALKRVIRYAADKGYDRIAWTPGKVQAERYDLSKHIKALHYAKRPDGTYDIKGIKQMGDRPRPLMEGVAEDKLADYVGDGVAKKIISGEGNEIKFTPYKSLSGLDLQIGGEGMQSFYDKIIPGVANKIGKKHGAKTEVTTIKTSEGDLQALSIPVSEKLKSAAQGGFPYYAVPLTVGGSGLLAEEQRRRRPVTSLLNP